MNLEQHSRHVGAFGTKWPPRLGRGELACHAVRVAWRRGNQMMPSIFGVRKPKLALCFGEADASPVKAGALAPALHKNLLKKTRL